MFHRIWRLTFIILGLLVMLPTPSNARTPTTLLAPHLGYGVNVWDQPDLTADLGFEWVRLFEEAVPIPSARLPYHVLYRVIVDGYADPPTFQQHIRDLVRAGRGKVEAYEIGNEPNIRGAGFWGEHDVDPETYARLLCDVYPIIKSEDSQAIVVSGGLAPVGRTPPSDWKRAMDELVYAQRMLDAMKANNHGSFCADAFGYHPFGFKSTPETDYHDVSNGFAFRSAEGIRGVMLAAGAGHMQMWATEFGWIRDPGSDPWTGEPGWATSYSWCNEQRDSEMGYFIWMQVTEQQQADYLVRAFQWADQNWPWMGPMFVWNLDLYYRGWSCSPHKFFSLYRATEGSKNQRTPVPAFAALRDMPRRSAWTESRMIVAPDQLSFVGVWYDPRPVTQTASIEHSGTTPITWTAVLTPPAPADLTIAPISGTTPATLTISAAASLFAITGTYTYTLLITADATTTAGSPFTLPITLRVLDHWEQVFLPFVLRNYTPPQPSITPTTRFGLSFVTSVETPAGEARFQRALDVGAGIDRWPLYWPNVETSEGRFEWGAVDHAVISDTEHGLQVNAILMLTPGFYATGGSLSVPAPRVGAQARFDRGGWGAQGIWSISSAASPPVRLDEPVFTDGTDTPGVGKQINPNNPWARFVYQAVNRYKPGGMLAQQRGWPADRGVRYWEIWNEEDYDFFWSGTPAQYARLLKVAYLAARHADPQARIIFGGLANFQKPNWLKDTLDVINTYPDRDAGNWFFDSVAEHNYAWSWQTWRYLYGAWSTLNTYSITGKTLWVTESGVALCDEYPGPPCIIGDSPVPYRANPEEQAAFVIQSAVYATWMNYVIPVDVVIHFLLYDDCSDPVPGTEYGGGFGLMRNPTDAPCFNNSPNPDTPRPSYAAFQSVTQYLRDAVPKWRARPGWIQNDPDHQGQEWISFYRPSTQERVLAMWARGYITETAVITATSTSAQLVWHSGVQTIVPTNGVYTVTLPAATNINTPTNDGSAPIGGRSYFLIEPDPSGRGGPRP